MNIANIKMPTYSRLFKEPLGLGELINAVPAWGILETMPGGNGEPVMVIPGLSTNDLSTTIVRKFLNFKGFSAYGWELGFNVKYTEKVEQNIKRRVDELYDKHQQKVSLIGWSLGGMTMRIFAQHHPEKIKQVISLGAPFSGIKGKTHVGWWYTLLAGESVQSFNDTWTKEAAMKPLMPSTSIYSKTDGMVSWEYCIDWETGPETQNIEVYCNHLGFGMNPSVWCILTDRLRQKEGEWTLFDESKLVDIEAVTIYHF